MIKQIKDDELLNEEKPGDRFSTSALEVYSCRR